MKKFCTFCSLLIFALTLGVFFGFAQTYYAVAEKVTGSKLEYFELNKPVSVCRDGEVVYIAEKSLVVIYYNDTYEKIAMPNENITNIQKCGNHLLVLSNGKMYTINLATLNVAPLALDGYDFSNVSAFAVNGSYFAVCLGDSLVNLFLVTDGENFIFESALPNGAEPVVASSELLALSGEGQVYFFASDNSSLYVLDTNSSMQGPYQKFRIAGPDCFAFDNGFYYKANDCIYSVEFNLQHAEPSLVVDFRSLGLSGTGDFCVNGNKILVCDTNNDRVLEFDRDLNDFSGFEISFTKINLPNGFAVALDEAPTTISVSAGTKLYDINLTSSLSAGYFVFNGYHNQELDREYLVVAHLLNNYYLVAGDCLALVLTSDFTPHAIRKTEVNKQAFALTNATTYILPRLTGEFISQFKVAKHQAVTQIATLTYDGIDYSLVSDGTNVGYLPSSFLVDNLSVAPDFNSFKTATTKNKAVNVFSDMQCSNPCDSLEPFTSVIITDTFDNCYQVIYGDNKVAFLPKSAVIKSGSYVNRIVAVIVLLAIAMLVTMIYLETKYLYNRRKLSTPKKRK